MDVEACTGGSLGSVYRAKAVRLGHHRHTFATLHLTHQHRCCLLGIIPVEASLCFVANYGTCGRLGGVTCVYAPSRDE